MCAPPTRPTMRARRAEKSLAAKSSLNVEATKTAGASAIASWRWAPAQPLHSPVPVLAKSLSPTCRLEHCLCRLVLPTTARTNARRAHRLSLADGDGNEAFDVRGDPEVGLH